MAGAELMMILAASFKDAVVELKQRTDQQEGLVEANLIAYIADIITADELLEETNLVLARFSGYRHFLLELTQLMIIPGPGATTEAEARSKVLAVEAEIEQQMSRLFHQVAQAMTAEPTMLLWTEYLGLSLS